jgi:hypothetical protein
VKGRLAKASGRPVPSLLKALFLSEKWSHKNRFDSIFLTSLQLFPSSIGHLHVRFGCGWPRWAIRGSFLSDCGFIALHSLWLILDCDYHKPGLPDKIGNALAGIPANGCGQHGCGTGDRNGFAKRFDGSVGGSVLVHLPDSFGLSAVGHAKAGEQPASMPLSPEIVRERGRKSAD